MVLLVTKKIGQSFDGDWWTHGRGRAVAKVVKPGPGARVDYTYLHAAVGEFPLLAYTEALHDEQATATLGLLSRGRDFFVDDAIARIHRVVTENNANHRPKDGTHTVTSLVGRRRSIHSYMPRHNGR